MEIPFEYFCNNCGQLRLCLDTDLNNKCGNCESIDIIVGKLNSLDKKELIKDWRKNGRRRN